MARKARVDRGLYRRADSSGKLQWYVRLSHAGQERRFGSFPNKTAAREFYEKAKQEQQTGHFFPERYQKGGSTLQAVVDQHLATFTGRSLRDEKRYRREWLKLFPGAKLSAVTPAALEQARARLQEGRAIGTVNRYMQFMRRCLNKAVRDQQIASNPMSQVKMFREPAGTTRYLSPAEEAAICEKIGPSYAPWVRLAILTGMRQLEQFSLRWEHVDLEHGVLTLPTTKAGGVQYVRLNEEAKGLIQSFILGNKSVWVFPSENPATHVDPRNFYKRVYLPAMKAIGLHGATWHTLRHTFASRLAMSGMTEGTIAALLRHSGTALVKRYAHLAPSYLQNAVETVSSFGAKAIKPMTVGKSVTAGERGDAREVCPVGTGTKNGNVQEGIEV